MRDYKGDRALKDLQKHISALCVEPYKAFSKWHAFGLPGPEYGWSRLAGWSAAVLKFYTGFDCGKFFWLPSLDHKELTPARVIWISPDPNEEIPPILLALFPFAMVSVVLTPRVDRLMAASPAILTKASSSPWTVDGTFNTANNTIYCLGPGGNGGVGTTSGSTGGGGGAVAFKTNYNNSWTPGTSTATFQVTGGNPNATNDSAHNTTFDSSAFVAACGGFQSSGGNANTVPAGGTTHNGGNGGTSSGGGGGSGGGGAAGTHGVGAIGGGSNSGGLAGGGGGGADNGLGGNSATGSGTGGDGGVSGLTGAVAGVHGNPPTSGNGGSGGGGGNSVNPPPSGADGSAGASGTVTPQFDATHGCGGGGGGGGGIGGANPGGAGGAGGLYGGGAGGGGRGNPAGSGGTGGDALIFILWAASPPASVTPIFGIFGGIEGSVTALALLKTLIDNNPIVSRRILLPKCKDGK